MNNKNAVSETITFLRFPLIVGVLAAHTHLPFASTDSWYPWLSHVIGSLSIIPPAIFFMISGYLFFKSGYSFDSYRMKLQKRVKSLLIPYLLWNLLYLAFIWLLQTYAPSLIGTGRKNVADYSFWEFLNSFWNFGGMYCGMPVLYAFWFIRDLLVINLFAPIVFFLIKKLDVFPIIVIVVVFVANPFNLIATDLDWAKGVLFYFIGAYFAVKGKPLFGLGPLFWPFVIISASFLFFPSLCGYVPYGTRLFYVLLAMAVPACIAKGVSKGVLKPSFKLAQTSFFVYGMHLFIIEGCSKLWLLVLPNNSLIIALGRVLIPILVSFICVFTYYMLNRIMPKTISILVGGR